MLRVLILFTFVAVSLAQCVYEEPCDDYADRMDRTGCRQYVWYDTDGSCDIEREEWSDRFTEIAGDDDLIDQDEFVNWWTELMLMCATEAETAWYLTDVDGSGYIEYEEYMAMYDAIDADGNGTIEGSEFQEHWNNFYPQIVDDDCTDGR